MVARRGYEELPDKENIHFTATLTPDFWAAKPFFRQRSRVLSLDFSEEGMRKRFTEFGQDPGGQIIGEAEVTSPGIHADGRKDFTEAIVGARDERPGLSVTVGGERAQGEQQPKPKRGLG